MAVHTLAERAPRPVPGLGWAVSLLPAALSGFLLSALIYYHLRYAGTAPADGALQLLVVGLYRLLGFVPSVMFAVLVLVWSVIWFVRGTLDRPWVRLLRIVVFAGALAILVSLQPSGAEAVEPGGWIGAMIASRLVLVLGQIGSTAVVAIAVLCALLLATDFLFHREFEAMARAPARRPLEAGVESEAVAVMQGLSLQSEPPPSRWAGLGGGRESAGDEELAQWRERARQRYAELVAEAGIAAPAETPAETPADPEIADADAEAVGGWRARRARARALRDAASRGDRDGATVEEAPARSRRRSPRRWQPVDELASEPSHGDEEPVTDAEAEAMSSDEDEVEPRGQALQGAELATEESVGPDSDSDDENEDDWELEAAEEADESESADVDEEDASEEDGDDEEWELDGSEDEEEGEDLDESEDDGEADEDEEEWELDGSDSDEDGDEEESEGDEEDEDEEWELDGSEDEEGADDDESDEDEEDEEWKLDGSDSESEDEDDEEEDDADAESEDGELDGADDEVDESDEDEGFADPVERDDEDAERAVARDRRDADASDVGPTGPATAAAYDDERIVEVPRPKRSAHRQGSLFARAAQDLDLLEEAAQLVLRAQRASTVFLQRRLRVSYEDAQELLDTLRRRGVVGGEAGSSQAEVLMELSAWEERGR